MVVNAWIPLSAICHGRSGDKGDHVNVGLAAHREQWYELLVELITPARLENWFSGMMRGGSEVFEVPGVFAVNCLLYNILQGGGTVSLRMDAQGKSIGPMLLQARVPISLARAKVLEVPLEHATKDEAGQHPL